MNAIFLDIDGTITSLFKTGVRREENKKNTYEVDDESLILLKKLINKFDMKVVLSSVLSLDFLPEKLEHYKNSFLINTIEKFEKYGIEIYDETPIANVSTKDNNYDRFFEITSYLTFHNIEKFIILDDLSMFNNYSNYYVRCGTEQETRLSFDLLEYQEAVSKLSNQKNSWKEYCQNELQLYQQLIANHQEEKLNKKRKIYELLYHEQYHELRHYINTQYSPLDEVYQIIEQEIDCCKEDFLQGNIITRNKNSIIEQIKKNYPIIRDQHIYDLLNSSWIFLTQNINPEILEIFLYNSTQDDIVNYIDNLTEEKRMEVYHVFNTMEKKENTIVKDRGKFLLRTIELGNSKR